MTLWPSRLVYYYVAVAFITVSICLGFRFNRSNDSSHLVLQGRHLSTSLLDTQGSGEEVKATLGNIRTANTHVQRLNSAAQNISGVEIISVGLPKTGTTATARALMRVGYNVSHNQGDRLGPRCQVIINTMEINYEYNTRIHPNAKWIITYSRNSSAWLQSLGAHLARTKTPAKSMCRYYGCILGKVKGGASPSLEQINGVLVDSEAVQRSYDLYYQRLFRYFEGREYALVDVRDGTYTNLAYIHENLKGPFKAFNTAKRPGQWPAGCPREKYTGPIQ